MFKFLEYQKVFHCEIDDDDDDDIEEEVAGYYQVTYNFFSTLHCLT